MSADDVAYLLEHKLSPLGVTEDLCGSGASARPSPRPRSFALRKGVVPEGAVRRLAGALRPLFLPPVVLAAVVGLVAVDTWLLVAHSLATGVEDVAQRPALLLLVVALTVLAGGFHELGHATASRYGGLSPG